MTEWWQVLAGIGGFVGGVAVLATLVLRYGWPAYKGWKQRQADALIQSKKALSQFLESAERWLNVAPFYTENVQRLTKDADTPRPLRKRLREVERLVAEYLKWLPESDYVIESLIEAEVTKREKLVNLWDYVAKAYKGMPPLEHAIKEAVRHMIYEGDLEAEKVKELLLENRRDYSVHFPMPGTQVWANKPPEEVRKLESVVKEPQIKLKDILDSDDFYNLVEHLKDLEHRPAVQMTRNLQKRLISEANDALVWVKKRLKEEGEKG